MCRTSLHAKVSVHNFIQSRRASASRALLLVCALTLPALTACGDDEITRPAPVATYITADDELIDATGTVGAALADPVSVRITDQYGQPVAGAVVAWSVESGNGTLASPSSLTNADGVATVNWTLGTTAGPQRLRAAVSDDAAVTIAVDVAASSPRTLSVFAGNGQTIARGGTSELLAVVVRDQYGNPVGNVPISWSTTGGTLSDRSTVTASNGLAFASLVTPAGAAGTYTVTATMPDGSTQMFTVSGS
jgi:adhesin/invasin